MKPQDVSRPSAILLLVGAGLATASTARADVLTCSLFKDRLDQTISTMGDRVPHPGPFQRTYREGSGVRLDWLGHSGFSASLTCGAADAFEDFGITIDESVRTSDALPETLRLVMELASASVCVLAEAPADACRALVTTMAVGSLGQFKESLNKADAMPTGTRDFFIVKGVDAELDMTPVGISWSIGPGLSMTVQTVKGALDPHDVDAK